MAVYTNDFYVDVNDSELTGSNWWVVKNAIWDEDGYQAGEYEVCTAYSEMEAESVASWFEGTEGYVVPPADADVWYDVWDGYDGLDDNDEDKWYVVRSVRMLSKGSPIYDFVEASFDTVEEALAFIENERPAYYEDACKRSEHWN